MSLCRRIQADKRANRITPGTCAAYAALHLAMDDGVLISPAPHHALWLRLLCNERIKKLLIVAPPESAKTTWTVSAYIGCRIGFWPEQSIIIGSASGEVAETRSMSLRHTCQSDNWRATFPNIERAAGMHWATTKWSVAPGGMPFPGRLHPTVAAYGTGGSITGSRADIVVADDLLDFENSRTKNQRDFVEHWLHNSFLSRRKSQVGRAVVIGTAWHYDDIYAKLRRQGDWVVCHTPLLSEGKKFCATITYPDDYDGERLGEPIASATL